MKCPHCAVEFHDKDENHLIAEDVDGAWGIISRRCSKCGRVSLDLVSGKVGLTQRGVRIVSIIETARLIHPKGSSRPPVPTQVPSEFAEDYLEACLVLPDSPKASAALGRRCLQHLLREQVKVKHQDLAKEIQEVLDNGRLPSHLSEGLDAIRNIGNFATHPIKTKTTGEIVPVEPGEAEWTLDVIESLFDFYFVQPDIIKRKKEALNKKLEGAGKPPMK